MAITRSSSVPRNYDTHVSTFLAIPNSNYYSDTQYTHNASIREVLARILPLLLVSSIQQ